MSHAVLIMCGRRVDELRQVVESVQALNPSIIYFHLHSASSDDEQKKVEAVLDYIESYQGENVLRYVHENLGIDKSMASALNWVAEKEPIFYVFEDDVPLKQGAELELLPKMQELQESGFGVLKFGLAKSYTSFWGWAVTASVAKLLTSFDFQKVEFETAKPFLDSKSPKTHLEGLKYLYENNKPMPFDDEYDFILKYLAVPVMYAENECTTHIGHKSTRTDSVESTNYVTFINGVIQQ